LNMNLKGPDFFLRIGAFFLFALLLLGSPGSLLARPKVGLALSGGGARGLSHIGVLRTLEQNRIPVDYIAGTSIGSFIGGLYAAGYTVDEIEKIFLDRPWEEILFTAEVDRQDFPFRRKIHHDRYVFDFELGLRDFQTYLPPGLVRAHKLSQELKSLFFRVSDLRDFIQLPIPFKAVATDLVTSERVVLKDGNLADSIRASCGFPGMLPPVEVNGRLLIDGGAVDNLPIDLVRSMGADVVIAVDVAMPLYQRDGLNSFVDVTDQVINMMVRKTASSQLTKPEVLLIPELQNGDATFAFTSMEQIMKMGEVTAQKELPKMKRFQLSESAFQKHVKSRHERLHPLESVKIDDIKVTPTRFVDARLIERQVRIKKGRSYTASDLKHAMNSIYGEGDYELVDYDLQPNKVTGQNTIELRPREKNWGPNYIRFGLLWDGEIKGRQDFNALFNFSMSQVNSLGAEWRNDVILGTTLELNSEWYQPLDRSGVVFVAPQFQVSRTDRDSYLAKARVSEYEVDTIAGQLDFGLHLYNYAELRMGIRKGIVFSDLQLGALTMPTFDVNTGAWVAQVRVDQLDHLYFPRKGYYLEGNVYASQRQLGADLTYRKIYAQAHGFLPLGNSWALFLSSYAGGKLGKDLPFYDEFQLGGFRKFSGFRESELQGQYVGTARSGFMYKIPMKPNFLWNFVTVGAWGEAGNVWASRDAISIHDLRYSGTGAVGFDTKLGAVFLGYGQSGKEFRQFYVSVGRSFGIHRPRFL